MLFSSRTWMVSFFICFNIYISNSLECTIIVCVINWSIPDGTMQRRIVTGHGLPHWPRLVEGYRNEDERVDRRPSQLVAEPLGAHWLNIFLEEDEIFSTFLYLSRDCQVTLNNALCFLSCQINLIHGIQSWNRSQVIALRNISLSGLGAREDSLTVIVGELTHHRLPLSQIAKGPILTTSRREEVY